MNSRHNCLALLLGVFAALTTSALAIPDITFIPTPTTVVNFDFPPYAPFVSGNGSVVVGAYQRFSRDQAFRWTAQGGLVDLPGTASLPGTSAQGINADGSVIAGACLTSANTGPQPAFWQGGGPAQVVSIPSPDAGMAGVSADGQVLAGRYLVSGVRHGYRWTASGGMTDVYVPGTDTYPAAISADGSTIVGVTQAQSQRAFRWTAATGAQDLGDLGGNPYSFAYDLSADGTVVVGYSYAPEGGQRAYRWTSAGGMQNLGTLPGPPRPSIDSSQAYGISADGNAIVGSAQDAFGVPHAFLWTPQHGMVDLNTYLAGLGFNLNGYILDTATDISSDGLVIVGRTRYDNDHQVVVPWIVTIPAPPSVLSFPLMFILGSRRRR